MNVFILGPSIQAIEPMPGAVAAPTPGRRTISFDTPPTAPGGIVRLTLNPALLPTDAMPVNVYAFFVQPVSSVPTGAALTTDFFFKSGAPNSSIHSSTFDAVTFKANITVPGVKPSPDPYLVGTILEFSE